MLTAKPRPKRCRHCKAQFAPARPLQVACGLECAKAVGAKVAAKNAARQAKLERAQDRARRERMKPLRKIEAEVQVVFNKFIRTRDRDKGCFVCGKPFPVGQLGGDFDAGHVRSRGAAKHLRFTADNCHGECKECNSSWGAKPHEIEAGAVARIGRQRYDELMADNVPHKFTREELAQIKALCQYRLRELKKENT
jgi:hypothetical protein